MELIPIRPTAEENKQFIEDANCADTIYESMNFYSRVGFEPPWICYYVRNGRTIVGSAAFKGKPVDGKVEIAYGTIESHRRKGVGTAICALLVQLARDTDPTVRITARTLPDNEGSKRVLRKNGFVYVGMVDDVEDGRVCEWEYLHLRDTGCSAAR